LPSASNTGNWSSAFPFFFDHRALRTGEWLTAICFLRAAVVAFFSSLPRIRPTDVQPPFTVSRYRVSVRFFGGAGRRFVCFMSVCYGHVVHILSEECAASWPEVTWVLWPARPVQLLSFPVSLLAVFSLRLSLKAKRWSVLRGRPSLLFFCCFHSCPDSNNQFSKLGRFEL